MGKGGFTGYAGTQVHSIRGITNIARDTGLIYLPPGSKAYGEQGPGAVVQPPSFNRMSPEVDGFWVQNNSSGADGVLGIGIRYRRDSWVAGAWDNSGAGSGTAYTQNNDFKARTAVTLDCATVTDGMLIGCTEPFGWITWNVTTASVTNAVSVVAYWSSAGTWVAPVATATKIGSLAGLILAAGVWAIGEHSYAFDPADDWHKVGEVSDINPNGLASPDTTVPGGMYWLRITTDGDPSVNPIITGVEIGSHLLVENVDDEGTASRGPNLNFYSPIGDGVVALNSLSGTANIAYHVTARARG